jgi:DNA-binding MarR family transcriptional regulator/predicted N-acetyltransferase YhbS
MAVHPAPALATRSAPALDAPAVAPPPVDSGRVASVRHFNRFYTKKIGVLNDRLMRSPYSLAEARVLYELAQRARRTATELKTALDLDAGYLSRILRGFEKKGLIAKERSEFDGRSSLLSLTPRGRKAYAPLDAGSNAEVGNMMASLDPAGQSRLVEAMAEIETLLGAEPPRTALDVRLRPHAPGDMGWVLERHGAFYAEEYGWGPGLEANVADTIAAFLHHFDPSRERCWIAELGDERVGSIFLVKRAEEMGQLRLLLVEPKARGLGLGTRLVEECLAFARHAGYRKVMLWTHSVLEPARRIYARAGFRITHKERHRDFGLEVESEYWEIEL